MKEISSAAVDLHMSAFGCIREKTPRESSGIEKRPRPIRNNPE